MLYYCSYCRMGVYHVLLLLILVYHVLLLPIIGLDLELDTVFNGDCSNI